ncbi:hypothetical protein [Blastococcus saxobsidens]|uniref:Uncharacterized protein n=1 Tax=Blastococcus saxobsidens (strain DD2) TaxID=1146883 RepID=H6RV69_BLASD|nr:hypothetical protein [Blastococcus saxobsidens]CCG05788.1 protein of unknown function [Blastococcus saxobsidens DD2]
MAERGATWTPQGFEQCLQTWDDFERPDDDLRLFVVEWIFSRLYDPYQGVKTGARVHEPVVGRRARDLPRRRQGGRLQLLPEFTNLWWGAVPGTFHDDGRVVVCSYWVVESEQVVRCESLASLSWPV